MMKFLEIVKLVAALYPVLMQTVKALEAALPEPGQGSLKLEMLKSTLQGAYDKMDDAKVKFEELWPSLQLVVGTIVTIFNTTGVFKKK